MADSWGLRLKGFRALRLKAEGFSGENSIAASLGTMIPVMMPFCLSLSPGIAAHRVHPKQPNVPRT